MVCTTGSVCCASEGEDDRADRTSGCAKDPIVRSDDAIGVIEQVLSILQAGVSKGRIHINGHTPTGAGAHQLRRPLITGPCRRS